MRDDPYADDLNDAPWKKAKSANNPRHDDIAEDEGSLPEIKLVGGELAEVVDQAEDALQGGAGLYQRSGMIVHTVTNVVPAADGRQTTVHRIVPALAIYVSEVLTRRAQWLKRDKRARKWLRVDAPTRIAEALIARGQWRLPSLQGIVTAPILRPDGSLLDRPGYDPATALIFDPLSTLFPSIPPEPSPDDALAALAVIGELLAEFPFVSEIDRAVAISAILTALVRRSLPTAPMHGFTAPVAGSGKSFLIDIAAMVSTGDIAPVTAQPVNPRGRPDEAELEKRLVASLAGADSIISIDNCSAPLGGSLLCQMTTQERLRPRLLGVSINLNITNNASLFANGNNLAIDGDLTRRVLLCRLDPQVERPELRHFERDPIAMIKTDRGRYVAAALTIIRAYLVAGQPKPGPPLASFEKWAQWIRDAIVWLGLPDVAESLSTVRSTDTSLTSLAAVVEQWHTVIGDDPPMTASAVIKRACEFSGGQPVNPDFRDALLAVAGKDGSVDVGYFGTWLRSNKDRVVGNRRIIKAGEAHHTALWQCQTIRPEEDL